MKHIWYRTRQFGMACALRLFEKISPEIECGDLLNAVEILKKNNIRKLFLVVSNGTLKRGMIDQFLSSLKEENIEYVSYTGFNSEPDIEMVLEGEKVYRDHHCEAFVCIGGGSVIDGAKVIAARIVRPNLPIEKMKGLLQIRRKFPLFIAVPTTAGTGSEVTAAAVVAGTRNGTHYKYAIMDFCLIPRYAVLDAKLTLTLPSKTTAFTGMDALTHALEAYTNCFASPYVKEKALHATKLIFENLEIACNEPQNLEARENMLVGSCEAGIAFTNNFVGNVHAIAHAIGGIYGVSHGEANAVLLTPVLRYYKDAVYNTLAEVADYCGIPGNSKKEKAESVIARIEEMTKTLSIREKFDCIRESDIPELVERAYLESIPSYPCPVLFERKDFETVIRSVMKEGNKDVQNQ